MVCDVNLVDKRNTEKLMDMLGLKKAAYKLARANDVRWYGYILRRPEENVLMKAIVHKMDRKCKQGQPRMKWRKQFKRNMRRNGLKKKDAADQCRWREDVRRVAEVVECIRPLPVIKD